MIPLYCITGLGADSRLFQRIAVPGYRLVHLSWIPWDNADTMSTYARKLAAAITGDSPAILGLSFGGMLAVEMARMLPQARVVILSSARQATEVAIHGGSISRWLIRSMAVPPAALSIPSPVALSYLGATTPDEIGLISRIIRDSDGRFMKWALKAIVEWKNQPCPANVMHIHGTADKTIPSARVHPDFWVQGGTHIMIYNRAGEVSELVGKCMDHLLKHQQ